MWLAEVKQRRVLRSTLTIILIGFVSLLSACATKPAVRVDQDRNANLAAYKSFGWLASEKPASSLTEERIRGAVIAALQSKGYKYDDKNPDYRVAYTLNAYQKPKDSGMRIGLGAGGGSGHVGGGVGLSIPIGKRSIVAGTLTLDVVDAARKTQVWTGAYESNVEEGELAETTAQKMVAMILAKWPDAVR